MLRVTRVFGSSVAVLVLAGALAPIAAQASPLGRLLHLHPGAAQSQDIRISVRLYNRGHLFQDVKVGDKVYTVMPHQSIRIKAPAGTAVYADSTGQGHRKGDLLFAVSAQVKDSTITLN